MYPDLNIKLAPIIHGDNILNKFLSKVGVKRLFIKEWELALLKNKTDIAIYFMKNLPINIVKERCLISFCRKGNVLNTLLSNNYESISQLLKSAAIGTSSLRRQCQRVIYRLDLIVYPLRGNVENKNC